MFLTGLFVFSDHPKAYIADMTLSVTVGSELEVQLSDPAPYF